MKRLQIKINNFQNALDRLKEAACELDKNKSNSIIRDGLIQRFEFTYELSWKTARQYMEDMGIFEKTSPRAVIKEAYIQNLIEDEESWLLMISDRNLTSHVYSEKMAEEISSRIMNIYIDQFDILINSLNG